MNDRIKLAEAMGWRRIQYPTAKIPWRKRDMWKPPNRKSVRYKNPPDPFTDANDDYAVLKWMTNPNSDTHEMVADFHDELSKLLFNGMPGFYKIGDWARAALKVLE